LLSDTSVCVERTQDAAQLAAGCSVWSTVTSHDSPLSGDAGALADQLQVIINELADKHNTPRFVPHVTVAGPIEDKTAEEVLKTFQELGSALPVR